VNTNTLRKARQAELGHAIELGAIWSVWRLGCREKVNARQLSMEIPRLRPPLMCLVAGLVLAARAASAAPAESSAGADMLLQQTISDKCPHAAEALKVQHQAADRRRAPPIQHVERPMLQRELILRSDQDQAARGVTKSSTTGRDLDMEYMKEVDADNLRRLKHIIRQDGFPTARVVGYDGLQAAWLLVQHADSDPAFQAEMLTEIRRRVKSRELDLQNYALLTDRVLLAQGKKQRYGTQFEVREQGLAVRSLEDPGHVDERRRALGLISLADYACTLKAFNDVRAGR
jgi:hypothetical protein